MSLVVLGSLTTSREQLALFLQRASIPSKDTQKTELDEALAKKEAEILLGKVIFIFGIITILLGVVNNIVRPAESYDTCAKFNSKFSQFQRNLDLQILKRGGLKDRFLDPQKFEQEFKDMCSFLINENNELTKLINEYNEARSLSPRQANIQALNNQENKDELEKIVSDSCKPSDSATTINAPIADPIPNSNKVIIDK
jgi:NTP pyrophosphatase (non-canonical NTP hydrolase)